MHELAIASSVLEAARTEAEKRPGMRLAKIVVRIGDLAGVDSDSLSFCYEALVKETDLERCTLEIERIPQHNECPRCRHNFTVANFEIACPACGSVETRFAGGDELELAYLEMEDA